MRVRLNNVSKNFDGTMVVKNLNLNIEDGEFMALLGPSGCGKTTTLLMIAGIYRPSEGTIEFDGRIVNRVPAKDRHLGMVFQSYALYPHMTVYENLAFPLTIQRKPKAEIRREVIQMAEMLGLTDVLDRKPGMLSGGQQQRVALGRALIKKPRLLLFDEPLSNLDARLRVTMRAEIKRLQKELGITTIYVTHDQTEALTMADRIAVMRDGALEAVGPAEMLYERPPTLFAAEFIGHPPMNLLDVALEERGEEVYARLGALLLKIPRSRTPRRFASRVKMGIRPQHVTLARQGGYPAKVYLIEPQGNQDVIICDIEGAHVSLVAAPHHNLTMGDMVNIAFHMENAHFYDSDSGRSLL